MPPELRDDLRLAHGLAGEARAIARRHYRSGVAVERKADDTPVTAADREIEARLRELIAQQRPGDGVLGEEQGADGADRERVWVLDPIDGTSAFISASPLFGTLIALTVAGAPVLGLVELPALGERFVASGGRATVDGRPCRTRDAEGLADAVCATPAPGALPEAVDRALDAAVARRRWGGDCYAYCQVALGGVDVVVERGMAPHDYLALVPVVTGAGGAITDWDGRALTLGSGAGEVVAAGSAEVHAEALALIAEHRA